MHQKIFLLKDFDGNIDEVDWHKKKKGFIQPSFSFNAFAGSADKKIQSEHPALYYRLKKLRDEICSKKDLAIYMVASSKTLEEMVSFLPQTPNELEQIKGFGKVKVESYGQQFLDIIQQYSAENNLSSRIEEKLPKAKEKKEKKEKKEAVTTRIDTKAESFRLFKEGMKVDEIAKSRGFTIQTIEGHLAHYVSRGEIAIESLVSPEKILLIESLVNDIGEGPLTPIRERLGNNVGFGEIKLVMAWTAFKNGLAQEES